MFPRRVAVNVRNADGVQLDTSVATPNTTTVRTQFPDMARNSFLRGVPFISNKIGNPRGEATVDITLGAIYASVKCPRVSLRCYPEGRSI